MTTERRCEEWCGGTPGHGCSHVVRCYAGKAPCFGLRNADGWRIYGTPCRCSPECRDADARYWDKAAAGEPRVVSGTDAGEGTVEPTHFARDTAPLITSCGLRWSKSARFAWTDHEDGTPVTCPGCLAVVAPTPPAKPTAVEPRQRWRDKDGPYTVVCRSVVGPDWWCARRDDKLDSIVLSTATILADHYLGMAPAETPAPPGTKPEWYGHLQQRFLHKERPGDALAAPAPPGPAVFHFAHDTWPRVTRCGLTWSGANRFAWTDGEDGLSVMCQTCLALAAPAPGVGEGALTFAEAMALDQSEVEVRWNDINDWRVVAEILSAFPLKSWRMARYRRRPEPLPAPKPGKLDGLVDEWCDRDAPMPMDLARDVAREAMACVRRHLANPVIQPVSDGQARALDAAALELLGAEAGK